MGKEINAIVGTQTILDLCVYESLDGGSGILFA